MHNEILNAFCSTFRVCLKLWAEKKYGSDFRDTLLNRGEIESNLSEPATPLDFRYHISA